MTAKHVLKLAVPSWARDPLTWGGALIAMIAVIIAGAIFQIQLDNTQRDVGDTRILVERIDSPCRELDPSECAVKIATACKETPRCVEILTAAVTQGAISETPAQSSAQGAPAGDAPSPDDTNPGDSSGAPSPSPTTTVTTTTSTTTGGTGDDDRPVRDLVNQVGGALQETLGATCDLTPRLCDAIDTPLGS